jgi:hypothetical protein
VRSGLVNEGIGGGESSGDESGVRELFVVGRDEEDRGFTGGMVVGGNLRGGSTGLEPISVFCGSDSGVVRLSPL